MIETSFLKSPKVLKTAANKKKFMEFFDLRAVMGWEDGDNTFLYPREMEDFHSTHVKLSLWVEPFHTQPNLSCRVHT